jgi:hypothetical protein
MLAHEILDPNGDLQVPVLAPLIWRPYLPLFGSLHTKYDSIIENTPLLAKTRPIL